MIPKGNHALARDQVGAFYYVIWHIKGMDILWAERTEGPVLAQIYL